MDAAGDDEGQAANFTSVSRFGGGEGGPMEKERVGEMG